MKHKHKWIELRSAFYWCSNCGSVRKLVKIIDGTKFVYKYYNPEYYKCKCENGKIVVK